MNRRNILLLVLAACAVSLSAHAQSAASPRAASPLDALGLPLDAWLAGADRTDIPWRVVILPAQLQLHQRLAFSLRVDVPYKLLAQSGAQHDLLLVARVAAPDGRWHESAGVTAHRLEEELPDNAIVSFTLQAQVLPGDYSVGVVLYDRATRLRSVTRRPLHVPPLLKDPLPEAWKHLPAVEFIDPPDAPPARRTAALSRLWLPVRAAHPLEIELLVNFSSSEQFAGRRRVDRFNVDVMTALLYVLGQMENSGGTLRATGVDLLRRNVIFEGRRVTDPGWSQVFADLARLDAGVIAAGEIIGRHGNPAFFREVFASRAAEICGNASASTRQPNSSAAQPRRVLIVVSSGILFSPGADLTPIRPLAGCDLRVLHLRYQINRSNLWDKIAKLLRAFRPQRFEAQSPETFRSALAALLAELNRM